MPRKGFTAFFRGGQRWPNEGRVALVSPALLKILKAEAMLSVDTDVDPSEVDAEVEAVMVKRSISEEEARAIVCPLLDIPAPTYVDPIAQAMDEKARLDREKAALKAQLELEAARKEIEDLRRQLASKNKADAPEVKKKA